jgi:dTMP kinase
VIEIDLSGKLLVLEGLDFSGKSTQTRLLAERLEKAGHRVTATREPGGTPIGEALREILLSHRSAGLLPLSELLLFMASRAQHYVEVVKPALARGDVVLSSRYRTASLAYQGYGRGIDLALVRRLNDAATEGREADVTILIDLPPEVALARKRSERDRIEGQDLAFYERVRCGYLDLVRGDRRVHVLDGTLPVDEIASRIARHLGI